MVDCEWDEAKHRANVRKHGVGFEQACAVFSGPRLTLEDDRRDYGEVREISVGIYRGVVLVVVHTRRGRKTRIISARKANRRERERFYRILAGRS